jgi:hypothetical protein
MSHLSSTFAGVNVEIRRLARLKYLYGGGSKPRRLPRPGGGSGRRRYPKPKR